MAAKLIWHSDTCPPKPVSGTSDSAIRAMPKILDARSVSASLRMLASTRATPTIAAAVTAALRRDVNGMSSREVAAECVRSWGFGSTSSTTKSTTTGITNRNEMR